MKNVMKIVVALGLTAMMSFTSYAATCESDADCAAGESCLPIPCPAIACDPDDPNCEDIPCEAAFECMGNGSGGWESSCETDADCPGGMACEVVGGMSTACAAGEDCEPETTEFYGCRAASCETDADCSGGTVCIMVEEDCEEVPVMMPCPPGEEDCDSMPEPEPCEAKTVGHCAPKWAAPCDADADCGDGFACVAETIEVCSGGAPTTPAPTPDVPKDGDDDAGDDDEGSGEGSSGAPIPEEDPVEPQCETIETGNNICEPKEVICNSDADCPDEWTCEIDMIKTASVDCPPGANCLPEDTEPAPVTDGKCMPAGWQYWGGGGGDLGGPSVPAANPEGAKGGSDNPSSGGIFGCSSAQSPIGWLPLLLLLPLGWMRRRQTN